MSIFPYTGKEVVVWNLPVEINLPHKEETTHSGIVSIVDYVDTERGDYVILRDACYEYVCFDVDMLVSQINPQWAGDMQVAEREMEFAAEMQSD